ncbi:hypothetical protein AB0C13_22210 [Streptomyces sp. NPDC049099]|uniref:hypothetical protein n=1 Tax=Streptomyces sp. NPDC049099 TaxID=3155768 RepID=UPI003445D8EE
MSLRDRIRDAAYNAATTSDGDPAGARRATQTASVLAQAAEGALTNYVYPPGEYATFREDTQR